MRKRYLLIIILLTFVGFSNAQKSKIVGTWLITKVEVGDKVENPYQITDYTEDGKMVMMGMEVGSWDFNKKTNAIVMKSEFDKDFNGEGKILKLTKKELVVEKDGVKAYYQKTDMAEVASVNKTSKLMGTWEFKDMTPNSMKSFITFREPDEFTIIQKEENSETTINGTWIFNKKDRSLIMISFNGENAPTGECKIVKLDDNVFELENNGKVFKASKKQENKYKIERLNFSQDDFFTEDGNYKYQADQEKLPWLNWSEMKTELLNVTQLVYKYSNLINNTESFEDKTLTANVTATLEEEGFNIDYIFNGFDSYNIPKDIAFPSNPEYSNPLYPLNDTMYRVVGNEQITTPAGTFDCTVLEVFGDSDVRKKLWMINNKIGVYAKIIEDNPDERFGSYHIYELKEIKE